MRRDLAEDCRAYALWPGCLFDRAFERQSINRPLKSDEQRAGVSAGASADMRQPRRAVCVFADCERTGGRALILNAASRSDANKRNGLLTTNVIAISATNVTENLIVLAKLIRP